MQSPTNGVSEGAEPQGPSAEGRIGTLKLCHLFRDMLAYLTMEGHKNDF